MRDPSVRAGLVESVVQVASQHRKRILEERVRVKADDESQREREAPAEAEVESDLEHEGRIERTVS